MFGRRRMLALNSCLNGEPCPHLSVAINEDIVDRVSDILSFSIIIAGCEFEFGGLPCNAHRERCTRMTPFVKENNMCAVTMTNRRDG